MATVPRFSCHLVAVLDRHRFLANYSKSKSVVPWPLANKKRQATLITCLSAFTSSSRVGNVFQQYSTSLLPPCDLTSSCYTHCLDLADHSPPIPLTAHAALRHHEQQRTSSQPQDGLGTTSNESLPTERRSPRYHRSPRSWHRRRETATGE